MKFVGLLVLAFATATSAQCNINVAPGTTNQTCNGNRYVIAATDACVSGGCGLIFDVHGFTMNTESQNSGTQLRQLGTAAGYVVVHPQANGFLLPSWSSSDDINVFNSLLAIADAFNVNKARIHFGGFSQGGWMTWRMICNTQFTPRPRDVIASFGPIAAGLGNEAPNCFTAGNPGTPTAILHTHGRRDFAVPFSEAVRTMGFIEAAQGPDRTEEVLHEEAFYTRTRFTGNGLLYETLFHDGAHCMVFPGGSGIYNCNGPFTTGQEILEFYQANPKV